MPLIRKTFKHPNDQPWAPQEGPLTPIQIMQRYTAGHRGASYDPEGHEEARDLFKATGGYSDFEDAAIAFGYDGAFDGQLVLPFINAVEMYPGVFPGAAQVRGDCESHDIKTAGLMTMIGDIAGGKPDEVTGKVEAPPEISAEGIKQGGMSSEWPWWWRGYNSDGWSLDPACEAVIKHGTFLRNNYTDIGIDFTEYTYNLTAKYGSRSPPDNVDAVGRVHNITSGADISTFAGLRDACGMLFGIGTEGGEGFSSSRDSAGFSKRQGGWSHSYPFLGVDQRPVAIDYIKKVYGYTDEGAVLNCNNWGAWNDGPRDILDSAKLVPAEKKELWTKIGVVNSATGNIMIPEGCWWTPWRAIQNRGIKALSGFRGWARKPIDNMLI